MPIGGQKGDPFLPEIPRSYVETDGAVEKRRSDFFCTQNNYFSI